MTQPQTFAKTKSILQFRSIAWNARVAAQQKPNSISTETSPLEALMSARHPLDLYAYSSDCMEQGSLQRPEYSNWLSVFQHRQLIVVALLALDLGGECTDKGLKKYVGHANIEFKKILRNQMALVEPEFALRIEGSFTNQRSKADYKVPSKRTRS